MILQSITLTITPQGHPLIAMKEYTVLSAHTIQKVYVGLYYFTPVK